MFRPDPVLRRGLPGERRGLGALLQHRVRAGNRGRRHQGLRHPPQQVQADLQTGGQRDYGDLRINTYISFADRKCSPRARAASTRSPSTPRSRSSWWATPPAGSTASSCPPTCGRRPRRSSAPFRTTTPGRSGEGEKHGATRHGSADYLK